MHSAIRMAQKLEPYDPFFYEEPVPPPFSHLERLLEELSFSAPDRAGEVVEVTVEMVVANMRANLETAKQIIRYALPAMETLDDSCGCGSALAGALITAPAPASRHFLKCGR